MKFSCCIEMIYTEYPFLERIQKAKDAGFDYLDGGEVEDWIVVGGEVCTTENAEELLGLLVK